jgi:hypothetical protein
MKTARLALFAAIAQCAAAFAQDLPGQVDLRAAYCIGVHKALESNDQSIRELGDSPPDRCGPSCASMSLNGTGTVCVSMGTYFRELACLSRPGCSSR